MKKVYLCLLAGASLALASCSSDDLTAVGGGYDTTGGGSTSTVTPVSTPSVPLDNWKKARISVNSPAVSVVSLSYTTAGEGETPIVDNYVVQKGLNDIEVSVPTYVDEVELNYNVQGSEVSAPVQLTSVSEVEGTIANYTDSNGGSHESVTFYYYPEEGEQWYEVWTKAGIDGDTNNDLLYLTNWKSSYGTIYDYTEIDDPRQGEEGGEEVEVVVAELELPYGVTNWEGKLETAPGMNKGTTYHTSGVVMFSGSWPWSAPIEDGKGCDMNDVVLDYNIESVVVDESDPVYFANNDWKEGITVTMHVRAVGSKGYTSPEGFGVKLEGLNEQYIAPEDDVQIYLAAGQGRQYEMPECLKDIQAGVEFDDDGCAYIWVDGIQALNSSEWLTSEYILNDSLKGWAVERDLVYNTERYSLLNWLSTGEDYINRGGPLVTVKVKLNPKTPRASIIEQNPTVAKAQVEAFKSVAANSASQNFFIFGPKIGASTKVTHVGGFAPLKSYETQYESSMNSYGWNAAGPYYYIHPETKAVWGIKAPMLVKHVYEGEDFYKTYSRLLNFLQSDGKEDADWYDVGRYNSGIDENNLVKYW